MNHPPGASVLPGCRPWRPSPAVAPGSARGVRTCNPPACGSRRPGRISPAATQVRRLRAGGAGAGLRARGRGRGLLARASEAPRAVAPAGRPCAASAADGGGGAGARGPARAPGAARSACEPPAGRDSGPEGEAGGRAGGRSGAGGERPPLPRALAEAAGDPRPASVSQSVSPLGCSAAPQPRLGGRGSRPGLRAWPRRGLGRLRPLRCPSLAASHPPRRPTPWVQRPPGRRRQPAPPGPGGPPLPRRPGAAPGAGRSRPESPAGSTQGCARTPEDITPARGWRRRLARRCGVRRRGQGWGAGRLCPRAFPPKFGPAARSDARRPPGSSSRPARGENPRRSPGSGSRWACCGREEGLDRKGHSCWRSGPGDRGDANGGAVMQQAACGNSGRNWGE